MTWHQFRAVRWAKCLIIGSAKSPVASRAGEAANLATKRQKKCRSVEIVMPADGTIAAHSVREDFGTSRFPRAWRTALLAWS